MSDVTTGAVQTTFTRLLRRGAGVGAVLLLAGIVALATGGVRAQGGAGAEDVVAAAMMSEPGVNAAAKGSLMSSFIIQRHAATGQVEWIGSLLVWLLLALSVLAVALVVRMAHENRRSTILPPGLPERVRKLLRDRRQGQAVDELAVGGESFFGAVMRSALLEAGHGHSAMLRAGELAAEEQTVMRLRRLEPLSVLGNVAPMIGLFGTVYGIILAFREIVLAGGTPDPVNLAAGIGTALVTTFWGLVVAIPSLAAYGLLRNSVEGTTVEACRIAEQLVNEFRPVPPVASGPVRRSEADTGREVLEAVIGGVR